VTPQRTLRSALRFAGAPPGGTPCCCWVLNVKLATPKDVSGRLARVGVLAKRAFPRSCDDVSQRHSAFGWAHVVQAVACALAIPGRFNGRVTPSCFIK
jgi:hypothetical protein